MMTRITPKFLALGAAVGIAALAAMPHPAAACSVEPYLGSVCMTAATYCPRGFEPANGQVFAISQYQALFALLGCTYGGDCRTTFALPDLRGRSPVGVGQGPGLTEVLAGQKRGVETVTQTLDTLAPHTHVIATSGPGTVSGTIDVVPGAADATTGTTAPVAGATYSLGAVGGKAADGPYTTASPGTNPAKVAGVSVTLGDLVAAPTGDGQTETNLPPQTAVLFCVAMQGLFPSRE